MLIFILKFAVTIGLVAASHWFWRRMHQEDLENQEIEDQIRLRDPRKYDRENDPSNPLPHNNPWGLGAVLVTAVSLLFISVMWQPQRTRDALSPNGYQTGVYNEQHRPNHIRGPVGGPEYRALPDSPQGLR